MLMAVAMDASARGLSTMMRGPAVSSSAARAQSAGLGTGRGISSPVLRSGFTFVNKITAPRASKIQRARGTVLPVMAVAMQDSVTDEDSEGIGEMGLGQRELKDYPPGLKRYETMAVLRPDISEEQRLALTQRYEEAIIAGGGLDVEMFNRGMQPLNYNIRIKSMSGLSSRYLDGIYLLFTYVTKPESQTSLQKRLNTDDDIIRSTTFRLSPYKNG